MSSIFKYKNHNRRADYYKYKIIYTIKYYDIYGPVTQLDYYTDGKRIYDGKYKIITFDKFKKMYPPFGYDWKIKGKCGDEVIEYLKTIKSLDDMIALGLTIYVGGKLKILMNCRKT